MKKSCKYITFFVFFLLTGLARAQDVVPIVIEWEKNNRVNGKTQLNFNNAFYEPHETLLPYFSYFFQLTEKQFNDFVFEVDFRNAVFENIAVELSPAQQKQINQNLIIRVSKVKSRSSYGLNIYFLPIIYKNNRAKKLTSVDLIIHRKYSKKTNTSSSFTLNDPLSSGKWIKVPVNHTGVHAISYEQLLQFGFDLPQNVYIYGSDVGMLSENNADFTSTNFITKSLMHFNRHIYFFAKAINHWKRDSENDDYFFENHVYAEHNYVFITQQNIENPHLIQRQDFLNRTPNYISNAYDCMLAWNTDSINIIESGKVWFGKHYDYQLKHDFNFSFKHKLADAPLSLQIQMAARSPFASKANIQLNENIFQLNFLPVSIDVAGLYADLRRANFEVVTNQNNIQIQTTYSKNAGTAEAWLDYIQLKTRAQLVYESGNQLLFSDFQSVADNQLSEFFIRTNQQILHVWDVTLDGKPLSFAFRNQTDGIAFRAPTSDLRQFVVFNLSDAIPLLVAEASELENQNLLSNTVPDMVIISPQVFISQAERLAALRQQNDTLDVRVVTPQQIYNRFSYGVPDIMAIRRFLMVLYQTNPEKLKYLLLFGDGSVDNKTNSSNNTNFILTYQSENSTSTTASFVSDDFFGLLDPEEFAMEGLLDIGIGRLPVKNNTEAKAVVDKIIRYENSNGKWQNTLCFIADDADDNQNFHMTDADYLTQIIDTAYPYFNIKKIYLDSYVQQQSSSGQRYPEVNNQIIQQMNKGALLFNYTGHGSENRLAHENILDVAMINSFNNSDNLPVFMTATCEFGRFDMFSRERNQQTTSAGELLFLNPNGGAVAMFTTTRVVYSNPNFLLNKNFYNYIFMKNAENHPMRLGDVMRLTKVSRGLDQNKRNFTLFGDPAMKLKLPENKILLTDIRINDLPVDTISALDKVEVTGEVDFFTLKNYQIDTLDVTVFDKAEQFQTRSNDGYGNNSYSMQQNILYTGKASIKNGKFNFRFYVPSDINYRYANGKISFFCKDNPRNLTGFFTEFLVGGSSNTKLNDTEGPEIKMFLNSPDFANGATTGPNPVVNILLKDSTAINTSSNSIGHDLLLVVDNDTQNSLALNDYYEADLDDYSAGKIQFPLYNLSEGKHTLKFKAWDINANSSEKQIQFYVNKSDEFLISKAFNYPNPFSTNTAFYFNHNQNEQWLNARIIIFAPSGKIIQTLHSRFFSNGNVSKPIYWNGTDQYGNPLARGVYFYQILVENSKNQQAQKYQKIMIVR